MKLLIFCFALFYLPAAQALDILLTNDDGIDAPGIKAIHQTLKKAGHKVILIAPATQQSGASASITSGEIKFEKRGEDKWAVFGRPADAARVALGYLLKDDLPDLVISGANFGQNAGRGTNHSGTVGAALTAFHYGVPAIAMSVEIKLSERSTTPIFASTQNAFQHSAVFLVKLIDVMDGNFPQDFFLNVNYPALPEDQVKGVRLAELSEHSLVGNNFTQIEPGTLRSNLVMIEDPSGNFDAELLQRGYITISLMDGNLGAADRKSKRQKKQFMKLLKGL